MKVQLPFFMHKYYAVQMETIEDRTKTTISLFLVETSNLLRYVLEEDDTDNEILQGDLFHQLVSLPRDSNPLHKSALNISTTYIDLT